MTGYDYDTFAADLKALLDHLALDQDVVLAGFSMGTGEVTRYLGSYGSAGSARQCSSADTAIPPQGRRQPEGRPGRRSSTESSRRSLADSYAWFDSFLAKLLQHRRNRRLEGSSEAAVRASFQVAAGSWPYATYACIDTWLTDFRGDLPKIDIPVLAVHGTADRILPLEKTAARLRDEHLIADLRVVEVAGGPHNIAWTHADEINSALLSFLGSEAGDRPAAMATAGQV